MNDILFLEKLSDLNKTRKTLLDDLFADDNIEKAEKIDEDIIKLKSNFFNSSLKWKEVDLQIENFLSIHPKHSENIYLPDFITLELEYSDYKYSLILNGVQIIETKYIEDSIIVNNRNNISLVIDNVNNKISDIKIPKSIQSIEIKSDNSFVYIFINSLEVFKTLKPSEGYSLTI